MLKGLYVDVNTDSRNFKIKNCNNETICKIDNMKDALMLVNEINKLQKDNLDTFNKLTNSIHANNIYLNAIKEIIYNNNFTPAKEILDKVNPKFDEDHTTPNQFMSLSKSSQLLLTDGIKIHVGDILYNIEDSQFYTIYSIKDENILLYIPGFEKKWSFNYKNIGKELILCYVPHQLWNFLEDFLDKIINIGLKGKMYVVYSPELGRGLGYGYTKIEALWNSVSNVLK
jgi:hypothetical protein